MYVYPDDGQPWLAGGTLCYTRAYWERNPFPDLNFGEDTQFVWGKQPTRMVALDDASIYVALVHSGNTCRKRTYGRRWHPYPASEVRRLLAGDWAFYHQDRPSAGSEEAPIEQAAVGRQIMLQGTASWSSLEEPLGDQRAED